MNREHFQSILPDVTSPKFNYLANKLSRKTLRQEVTKLHREAVVNKYWINYSPRKLNNQEIFLDVLKLIHFLIALRLITFPLDLFTLRRPFMSQRCFNAIYCDIIGSFYIDIKSRVPQIRRKRFSSFLCVLVHTNNTILSCAQR